MAARKHKSSPINEPRRRLGKLLGLGVLLALGLWTVMDWLSRSPPPGTGLPKSQAKTALDDRQVFGAYGGSASCRDCHTNAYTRWLSSHHALAERPLDLAADLPVFYPPRSVKHGTQVSEARYARQRFELSAIGADGARKVFPLERVIGAQPLRQFLVAGTGGRWQVTEVAADPDRKDWFDIFGDEDRQPGEWGHWTGRGMTWNSMCAACHNTRLRKHYAPETDQYATTMAEMGVGCEACHGPMADHARWQRQQPQPPRAKDPTLRRLTKEQMLAACGACHARRTELTGEFQPGDPFLDHFGLAVPDETDLYYADGQVREEDYELTSFLGSRMYGGGVSCGDCHDPHSAKPYATDNYLCLRCHGTPIPPAPKIEATRHSFHRLGLTGDACKDCHMPQTVYMQRHWRHDHGLTIPDPLLTKQHGVPNACNRCHKDKTVDWALVAVENWYGKRMDRPTRVRAQTVALARAAQPAALPALLKLIDEEKLGLWRAVATGLSRQWIHDPAVIAALVQAAGDPDPLVRTLAARSLEPLAGGDDAAIRAAYGRLLEDPVRSVRFEAAWANRSRLDTNSTAGTDLMRYLGHNSDQPSGRLQLGVLEMDRGQPEAALASFRLAVAWDRGSAALRQALAVALSLQGKSAEALQEQREACRLAPKDPEYRFKLGLALNEAGRLPEAINALEETVKMEPQFAQAWYNLGLARAAAGQEGQALEALARAEGLTPRSAQVPYARATVLARLGRKDEARAAARRALELKPAFTEAEALLDLLQR